MKLDHASTFGGIETGVNVDIKRSDGRIHSAIVTELKIESRTVSVEWFENNETKGKEIDIDVIFSLNQNLAPSNNVTSTQLQKPQSKFDNKSRLSRQPERQSNYGPSQVDKIKGRKSFAILPGNQQSKLYAARDVERNPAPKQESMPPPKAAVSANVTKAESRKTTGLPQSQTNKRRSNAVQEVEKLQANREKRRAQQAQVYETQERLKSKDHGNPNWEFLNMIEEFKEDLDYKPLQDGEPIANHQITVCIRKRPLSTKENKAKEIDVITIPTKDTILVHEPKTKVDLTKYLENQNFRFDYAFDETSPNELVYKYTAKSLVESIFDGGMATCFAYGQTGSGKTHTMGGEFKGKSQDSRNGIYALAAQDVFKLLRSSKHKTKNLVVSCSYFEIYSGKVFDLLSGKSKLRVLEDGKQQVQIVGLMESEVSSVEDVLKLITSGNNLRTSGQTSANANSSRSHAVFQIVLRVNTKRRPLHGKFSLIDLAGNERGADTNSANRQTRMEGAEINKSLLALKECIRALGRKGAHLPFRASKLTQVLRDSFIGENARTCMIAMINPCLSSCEHTLNTLRYADRVKELGTQDPAKATDADMEDIQEQEVSSSDSVVLIGSDTSRREDSGLAQLRSLNDGECSVDWYNFQESLAQLQELEEELVDSHKKLLGNLENWLEQDTTLLTMTNDVDYDQDAYAQLLEELIGEKQAALEELAGKAKAFRECLKNEEEQSNRMRR